MVVRLPDRGALSGEEWRGVTGERVQVALVVP
ncbi:hypothetical protein FB470_004785 [Amycolatopsis thermophila]|uniref:Uncharacterized protein n=1 Tax=Amycolatopsis thermophila TaxID=206084 RepID=A0ABU0EZP4_9PSEU|nr:hypothetical protein [Amycolatopsis thermophila]